MSDFDPGAGWREVTESEWTRAETSLRLDEVGVGMRWWVHEEPVPSLPTEPYTVIHVTWKDGDSNLRDLTLHPIDRFMDDPYWVHSQGSYYKANELAAAINSFEVLSEPRAVTAKAVLDLVRVKCGPGPFPQFLRVLDEISGEFGVTDE